jgi:hypothetical protein
MAFEPVLLTHSPHLFQRAAAHTCREFVSLPGESATKSNRAADHAPHNRFWKATVMAAHIKAMDVLPVHGFGQSQKMRRLSGCFTP